MTRLSTHPLPAGTKPARSGHAYAPATMEDPATAVMTDLTSHRAVTVKPAETLGSAERIMISARVRLLLVVDTQGSVIGVVSYRDLVGQKATAAAVREKVGHDSLPVSEVMTPLPEVEAVALSEVKKAAVEDIVNFLHARGRQHTLVTETNEGGETVVRGIFSITEIGAHLGINVEAGERAQSFSEVEKLLAHK
ncbi:MAG: CBS domain-containing protein [Gammaproteobacteria bacterium]|nr:CBS domain-containing protein [Gammaproteobacteria bacterium]